MGCKAVDRGVSVEGPDADGAIAAARYEGVIAKLELADQGGVTLKCGKALSKRGRKIC